MSGSTWGGAIGAVVGAFFGNPQLGWMIGSAIGGYVDPDQVYGPRLSDARTQTSRDGVAIPFGWGTFPLAGNIIWQAGVVEHKDTSRQGKGGPEVTEYSYTRSYAVGLCEGPIAGILQIKRNGKIVYDTRDDDTLSAEFVASGNALEDFARHVAFIRAENAKFINKCEIYLGDETQLPDPTMEAYEGVGNVNAHRGMAYIVVTDDDVTDLQGAIPQFEFVVSTEGTVGEAAPQLGPIQFTGTDRPWSIASSGLTDPRIPTSVEYEYGYIPQGSTYADAVFGYTSPEEAKNAAVAAGAFGTRSLADFTLRGWALWQEVNGDAWQGVDNIQPYGHTALDANDYLCIGLIYSRYPAEEEVIGLSTAYSALHGPDYLAPKWVYGFSSDQGGWYSGVLAYQPTEDAGTSDGSLNWEGDDGISGGDDAIKYYADIVIVCRPVQTCGFYVDPSWLEVPDSPGYYFNDEGGITIGEECTLVSGTYKQLSPLETVGVSDATFASRPLGPVLATNDANYDNATYWTDEYDAAVAAGDLPAGWVYGVDYPTVVAQACECVPPTDTITPGSVLLSTIVAGLCEREGLASTEYDVSQLTDLVPGFRVANEGDAASAIGALMPSYFFDCAEWDGKVRFIKRGGSSSFAINGDDLVERDGDAFERERVQEAELLRRVTVGYIDPLAAYGPTTQKWERRVGTVQAKGEASAELPLTLAADTAATIAKRRGLTAWGEPEKQKFSLPYRLAAITPTDIGSYTDDAGEVHYIRIMQAEDDGGIREIESSTNCAEAYGATATGVTPVGPTIRNDSLRGPTAFVAMNLPSLRTADNTPGMYIAAAGVTSGWAGADIYLSVDGGLSEVKVAQVRTSARMGVLTANITSSGEPLSVRMWSGGQLSSVTTDQLANRANGFSVQGSSRVSEIGQFQTATSTGTSTYDLTDLTRGQLGTAAASHLSGDSFVLLEDAIFLPLDASLAGKTLIFRAVSLGTAAESNATFSITYSPQFTGEQTIDFLYTEDDQPLTTESGSYYEIE